MRHTLTELLERTVNDLSDIAATAVDRCGELELFDGIVEGAQARAKTITPRATSP